LWDILSTRHDPVLDGLVPTFAVVSGEDGRQRLLLRAGPIDATTIRASTVTRSIPTTTIRTYASITIPLSSTRSRTSTRFAPATRFGRAELLARDAIFVTTIGSVPAITVITLLVA
jgi:hypothetical protein